MSIPKILCTVTLAFSFAFLLLPSLGRTDAGAEPSRCGLAGQAPRAATEHQLRTSVLCLVNLARKHHGVRPLHFNSALRHSATIHSMSMVRSGSFSHYGPGGSTLTTRIARAGYLARVAAYRVAENIGTGQGRRFASPFAIVQEWMHSAGHRENILDPGLHDFGVGVARGDPLGGGANAATYTLDFGARRRS
jgi:uncharacterized protein YkwD